MNFRHLRWLATGVLVLGLTPWSRPAFAQPGDGVHSSDGWKLTPAITLTGGYDSNLFRSTAGNDASAVLGAPLLYVEPSLSIADPGDRNFKLSLDAGLRWNQYFGGSTTTGTGGVIDPTQQSGLSARANLDGELNPKGTVGLSFDENFVRTNVPANYAGIVSYNWIANRAGATIGLHPGARVLDVELGYHWLKYAYQTEALQYLDRDVHRFALDTTWNFLPKTGLLLHADYGLIRWADSAHRAARTDVTFDPLLNANGSPFRAEGGLTGLLTSRIALRALAGYGMSMYDAGPNFQGVIGTVALGYTFGRVDLNNKIELGYQHDFRNSTVGNYYSMHQVFANYRQGLMDQLVTLHLGARFELRDYSQNLDGTQSATNNPNSLNDQLLIGEAGVRTNINDWLLIDVAYALRANFTNDQYSIPAVDPADPSLTILRKYTEHIVTLSTTFQY